METCLESYWMFCSTLIIGGLGLLLFLVVLTGGDSLETLAAEAARKALEMAKVEPDDIDLILMCTSTPEDLFGSAPQVSVHDVSVILRTILYILLMSLSLDD